MGHPVDIQRHNHLQIEMLNQRGGRTLSIVDLIRAGTINAAMAACAMRALQQGASLLTGARPGGAGKTTLMAALLNLLPPEVPIITVDRSAVIAEAIACRDAPPACYLAHEIGSGSYRGYIWGRDVADFLSLITGPRRIASCLHADTLGELADIVCSPPLASSPEALGRVGLILFMHVDAGTGATRRRVATFHQSDGNGGHRLLFQWHASSDAFEQTGALHDPAGLEPHRKFLEQLVEEEQCDSQRVRRRVVEFYRQRRARSATRR